MKIRLSHNLEAEIKKDCTLEFSQSVKELNMIELDALATFLRSLTFKIQEVTENERTN